MEYYNQNQFSLGNNNYNEEKEFHTEKNLIKKNPKNKSNQITIPKNRYSRSPKQMSKNKIDSLKINMRSPSPKYKVSSDLLYNDLNYTIIKKEMNIIEGDEKDLKNLKPCEKESLPKEKTYIIKDTNFKKIMDLVKKTEEEKKYYNNLEQQIKKKDEKINKLEGVNKSIISRNNELISTIKNNKKEYDGLIIELNKYDKIFNRFIYLIKNILKLYSNDDRILEIINEYQLNGLLNNYENSNLNMTISDLITKEQNENNEKIIELQNQLRDIEDYYNLFDMIKENNLSQNESAKLLIDKTNRINEITIKYNKIENNYLYLQSKFNNLNSEKNEELNKINKEIDVYKLQISKLTNEKMSLINENEKLKNKIGEMNKNENNGQSIKTLNSNVSSSNVNSLQKIDELNLIIQNKDNIINEYKKKIEVLQNENNLLNQSKNILLKRSEFENNKNNENEIIYNNNSQNNNNSLKNQINENNESQYYNELNENYMNLNMNNYNNSLNEYNKNNSFHNNSQEINLNNKFLNDFKINTQSTYKNNYFKDSKLDLDMKLLKKKIMDDERNMYFTGEDKEVGVNGVAYISDLFLNLYNQSKLIEDIVEKTEINN